MKKYSRLKTYSLPVLFVLGCWQVVGQNIIVQPYLQDASPNAITVMWETDNNDESIVEWGLTNALENNSNGTATASNGQARIHEVELDGLERFTKYFYRVRTGTAVSEIFSFKTPPFASDNESFRIISMSDMQRDGAFPNKFQEIVEDGIIDYLNEEIGGDLIDNVALVMIPGDLVVDGNVYAQWRNHFFTPAQDLLTQVPVYPVLGNHENNSTFFFQYFKMPDNGTSGFEEHWWYKDYGNVRIIGLDSNAPFSNQEQLDWLEALLDASCDNEDIDFVFAQLHHPHKSELWTPGESNYTGEVINLLEQFTTDCGKPSIHFFGHTHAYSRGNSRDHKHVWLNTATAGGAIDNWGEFPNADYDEFSVSQDEYGFVSVEITADSDPKVVVKRISRGDQDASLNNIITDSLTLRLNPTVVNTPMPTGPINEEVAPECVVLKAEAFSSPNQQALHGQSHWQVATDSNDFSSPAAESWKTYQNFYFDIDTQENDDLTDEKMEGLDANTSYWWRVRYRDRELNWSDWSTPAPFTTAESMALPNLLLNPGAENDLDNWTVTEGVVEAVTNGECNGIAPFAGDKYFAVGGLCNHSEVGQLIQEVDVTSYSNEIDTGALTVNFGGYLSNFSGEDLPEMKLIFYDENNDSIGTSNTLSSLNNTWTLLTDTQLLPALTRTIRVELQGTRNAGTDNDSYFDNLFLTLGEESLTCDSLTVSSFLPPVKSLLVIPNPVTSTSYIQLPFATNSKVELYAVDSKGSKINFTSEIRGDKIFIEKASLETGVYYFWVKTGNQLLGKGAFIVK